MALLAALSPPPADGPAAAAPEPSPLSVRLQLPDASCDALWHALTGDCGFCATLLGAMGVRPGCPW